jgi:CRP/FNR family transcriptional regulator/CRP/FNR family cyclic AMP-dependent transcriptional regulator
MSTSIHLLRKVPFLAALPEGDLAALARSAVRRQFRRGELVFQKDDPGDCAYIIDEGAVRIYLPGLQGTDLTLAVLGPGDFFGDLSLLDGRPRSASAAAVSDTSLITIHRSDFIALLRSRPDAAMAVLAVVARRLRETDEMAAGLAGLDAGGRLAKKLLELASVHGAPSAEGVLLDLLLTQEDLATMIGATRESVNRALSQFRRQGIVGNKGRRLVLRDIPALRRRCE